MTSKTTSPFDVLSKAPPFFWTLFFLGLLVPAVVSGSFFMFRSWGNVDFGKRLDEALAVVIEGQKRSSEHSADMVISELSEQIHTLDKQNEQISASLENFAKEREALIREGLDRDMKTLLRVKQVEGYIGNLSARVKNLEKQEDRLTAVESWVCAEGNNPPQTCTEIGELK